MIEIAAPLPDGSSKTVATGFAELDGGFPKGGPEFILRKNATVNGVEGMVQVYESGRVVSLTDIALDEAIAGFSREFGHPPDTLSGSLAWKNKLNFQRAYLTATQKGMGHQPAADWAIRQISFGRSRVERGYGELSVNATRLGEVDLGPDLGKHQVPTSIEITARRSRR